MEVVTLLPVLLSFFIGAPKEGQKSPPWNAAMLFTGKSSARLSSSCPVDVAGLFTLIYLRIKGWPYHESDFGVLICANLKSSRYKPYLLSQTATDVPVQTTLQDHPRRNSITALQYSLQNILDMAKFLLTIILSRPSQFKYAALVSCKLPSDPL